MLAMFSVPVPVLVRVTCCVALVVRKSCVGKVRLVVDSVTTGAVPAPERAAVCGLPTALSFTLTVAVRVPVAVGVKVTEIVQLAPPARLVPQVLVCE